MKEMLKALSVRDLLTIVVIALIGFQQFPVIRIGGSFKLYELAALTLLCIDVIYLQNFKFTSKASLIAFCFFVVSPVISYVYAIFFEGYPVGFYLHYPQADSFKFNFYIFPLLQLLYMFFNFAAVNRIIGADLIYKNFDKTVKLLILIGTGIAIYSLIALKFDVIRKLPQFIQNKSDFPMRSSGLSQEPSFYVLYQTWIFLFIIYSKHLFSKNNWRLILIINFAALLTTFSTTLASLILLFALSAFFLRTSLKRKLSIVFFCGCFVTMVLFVVNYLELNDLFDWLFVNKIHNFFSSPDHTLDSGGFRSFTTGIGIKIFLDNMLTGVGVGNSVYYMYLYENRMGIINFGEVLQPGSFPQNLFSIILSEQGIIGGLSFVLFIFFCLKKLWTWRNYSKYNNMFLIGALFNITAMLTIAPAYSLFIWVFIAMGVGYVKHIEVNNQVKIRPDAI